MSASTKLSTAVKAICYLAGRHPVPQNSAQISEHIGVNASKLRKILSMLGKDKIVISTQGTNGGFLLNRDPADLHLQEIYCAVEDRKAFHLDVAMYNGTKDFSARINDFFIGLFADVQVDIENKMKLITIQSVLDQINKETTVNLK